MFYCCVRASLLQGAHNKVLQKRKCELIPLPADNPETTVDESKTQCEDISKCFWWEACRKFRSKPGFGMVTRSFRCGSANVAAWPSKNFCTILRSCKEAQADYDAAREKILGKFNA